MLSSSSLAYAAAVRAAAVVAAVVAAVECAGDKSIIKMAKSGVQNGRAPCRALVATNYRRRPVDDENWSRPKITQIWDRSEQFAGRGGRDHRFPVPPKQRRRARSVFQATPTTPGPATRQGSGRMSGSAPGQGVTDKFLLRGEVRGSEERGGRALYLVCGMRSTRDVRHFRRRTAELSCRS